MVYKKYIKRGDKLFGPYYYKSVKKDGKVITQYIKGPENFPQKNSLQNHKKNHAYFLIFPAIFLILILGFVFLKPVFTGKVIVSVEDADAINGVLSGNLALNLEPNEFIPAYTKVLIENGQEKYEFFLRDLIKEPVKERDFYISGTDIFGFGEGYGIKENDLEVSFKMKILSDKEKLNDETKKQDGVEILENETGNEHEEKIKDKSNEEALNNSKPEEKTETPVESEIELGSNEIIEDTPLESAEEISEIEISETNDGQVEETIAEPETSENPAETEITSNAILNFFNDLFLTITGKSSLETIDEISAKVSKDNPFIYSLEGGQTAEIINSDKKVNLEIANNNAVVTTDYSGEPSEYLINLSELNVPVNNKNFEIKLIYNETEIYSKNKNLNFQNETNQTINEIKITEDNSAIQYGAILGEPVKWKKKVIANEQDIIVELPAQAENISVYILKSTSALNDITKIETSNAEPNVSLDAQVTGNLIFEYKSDRKGFFSKITKFITGRAIEVTEKQEKIEINISENGAEYEVEYATPAPISFEKNISSGKEIIVSSEVHYENILAFTDVPENTNLREMKLYQIINGSKILVDFIAYNKNNEVVESKNDLDDDVLAEIEDIVNKKDEAKNTPNGINKSLIYGEEDEDKSSYSVKKIRAQKDGSVSSIEWIVPSLSNQTYELILISKAEHLDSNKNFISDIYDEVMAKDDLWSEQINDSEYVRITFEKNLTNQNDITIFPRTISGTPNIEIYEFNKSEIIAEFANIIDNEYNKVYLTNLNGTQNIFDLKILNGSVEFDYIVDPIVLSQNSGFFINTTLESNNLTHLNVSNSSIVAYYPFDDNVSSTTVYDYTEKNNDGTANSTTIPLFNQSGGLYNGFYTFDGKDDNINVNTAVNDLATTTTGTWAAWIELSDATPSGANIINHFGDTDANSLISLQVQATGKLLAIVINGAVTEWQLQVNVAPFSDNTWAHVALVQDGVSPVLYVNGVAVAQTFDVSTDKTQWFNNIAGLDNGRIGSRKFNSGAETLFFNGSIDEAMIWNIPLNSTEVLALYRNQTKRYHGTGEMNFTGINFSGNNTINITLQSCKTNMTTSLRAKVNNGAYANFDSSCSIKDYNATGNLNSANVTIGFVSDANRFYTPLVIGNLTLEVRDTDSPTISYNAQTPADNSTIATNSIYVNVSATETNLENMSYYLYNQSLNISGLTGYWNFDRNTTIIRDLSKKGNDGTRSGGVNWTTGGAANLGNGFSFDGVNDFMNTDNAVNDLATTTKGTWSAWVKPVDATPAAVNNIITFGDTDANELLLFNLQTNGKIRATSIDAGTTQWVVDTTVAPTADNVWLHFAIVQNGIRPTFYVNGAAVAMTDVTSTNLTKWFNDLTGLDNGRIGTLNYNAGGNVNFFNGNIDEPMIFDRALSSTEISELYNRQLVNYTTYSTKTESINWTNLADDDYHYFVDAMDKSENYNFTQMRLLKLDATFPVPVFAYLTTNSSNLSQNFIIANLSFTETNLNVTNISLFNSTQNIINSTTGTSSPSFINFSGLADGIYYLNATIIDLAGNTNYTETRIIGLDTTFPTWSANETNLTPSTLNGKGVYFNITLADANPNTYIFSWYNGTAWENTSAIWTNNQEVSLTKTINVDVATINWTWYINDSANNLNQTPIWSVTLLSDDNIPPNISFANPTTNATNLSQNFIFANLSFADATSSISMANISLFNSTQNIINSTQGTTSTLEINFTGLADGTYYLNASVNDSLGNRNQTETRKIILDTGAPNLTINSPSSGTYETSTILFNATSIDATTLVSSCWYTINSGATNRTLLREGTSNHYSLTQTSISDSAYTARFYCNDSANNINNTQNVVFIVSTSVPVAGGPAPAAAGGGGGGAAKPEKKRIFNLGYNIYDQTISLKQVEFDKLKITNNGEIEDTYTINVETIEDIISFEEKELTLEPGESKEIEFKISSPKEPGIYTGKIIVRDSVFNEREVLVTINVKTEKSLFDITLTIPESLKTLLVGQNLISKIDLIQMGLQEKIDVTLNYVIKDFEGQTYVSESETIAVTDQKSYEKEFFTSDLLPGQYVLGAELIHPDGVAVASTHFVVEEKRFTFGKEETLLSSFIAVFILISLTIFLLIRKHKRVGKMLVRK